MTIPKLDFCFAAVLSTLGKILQLASIQVIGLSGHQEVDIRISDYQKASL